MSCSRRTTLSGGCSRKWNLVINFDSDALRVRLAILVKLRARTFPRKTSRSSGALRQECVHSAAARRTAFSLSMPRIPQFSVKWRT